MISDRKRKAMDAVYAEIQMGPILSPILLSRMNGNGYDITKGELAWMLRTLRDQGMITKAGCGRDPRTGTTYTRWAVMEEEA